MRFGSLFTGMLLLGASAFGQGRMHMGPGGPPPGAGGDFGFVRAEFGLMGKVVKSAPYSAQAVTQFTQTLADGNRIQRTNTASVARDSEGRTRTEQSVAAMGPWAPTDNPSKMVFIHDPVAGASYMLNPSDRTARQMPSMRRSGDFSSAPHDPARAARQQQRSNDNVKFEDLGTQVMEGLSVQGKRRTRTIPAGQFGNDRPIEIVTETWYSPELQTVVMSKTSDPRSGDSLFKLTNIVRSEPDHTLFQVPSDYTVSQGPPAGAPQMRRRQPQQ